MKVIPNPTLEQLRKLRGIIYAIVNNVTGKWYIGQTRNTFCKRYKAAKWWNKMSNPYLEAAYKKYGAESFYIMILDHGIKDYDYLNRMEAACASFFDTYSPNGYNLMACGGVSGESSVDYREKLSIIHSQKYEYKMKDIQTGEIITVKRLVPFAKKLGVSTDAFHKMFKIAPLGFVVANRYCHPDATLEDVRLYRPRITSSRKIPCNVYLNGHLLHIDNLLDYCIKNDLNPKYFKELIGGKRSHYLGYTMDGLKRKHHNHRYKWILTKNGRNFIVDNIGALCKENGYNDGPFYALVSGKAKSAYGYRLVSRTELDY